MIRVLLAEDSFVMREGIVRILEQADDIEIVAVFGDADALRAAIDAEPPDVVVTDIRMPPTHTDEGIRLATDLRVTHPEVGVIVLSQHAEPVYALALFGESTDGRALFAATRPSTTVGSITEPPAATRRIASASSSPSATRYLSR